jgi:site-specific DNA-methyltransferase (adenine-specific)
MGILLTLYPMENLIKESKKYGVYRNKMIGCSYDKIGIVSISDMLAGKTMELPTSLEVLKYAEEKSNVKQNKFEF